MEKRLQPPFQNEQKKLDELLASYRTAQKRPSILLHSCCGPCSSYVLEYLSQYFAISLLFYNPNIFPKQEYENRLQTQKQLLQVLPLCSTVKLIEGTYDPNRFLSATEGLEKEPEGGKRCEVCFRLRLEETAIYAKQFGFDYFSTTLSVSPYKNAETLTSISEELSLIHQIKALPANFKKRGGYQRSIQLSKAYDLYRQDYCGCPYSAKKKE